MPDMSQVNRRSFLALLRATRRNNIIVLTRSYAEVSQSNAEIELENFAQGNNYPFCGIIHIFQKIIVSLWYQIKQATWTISLNVNHLNT